MATNYLIQKSLGTVTSENFDPFKPVETARWSDWSYATDGGDAWTVNQDGVATAALTVTASTKPDGTYTDLATTGGNGVNCLVGYTVASNVASSLVIVQGGAGYDASDVLSVTGDTVTLTVSTLTNP